LLHIAGPDLQDQEQERFTDAVAARTVSTYPYSREKFKREGDPIADCYGFTAFKNRMLVVVTDGCGTGTKPLMAASRAATSMINELKQNLSQVQEVRDAGLQLVRATAMAHSAILEGREDIWDAGTTTLLGGILMEVERSSDLRNTEWCFVCLSVGNCKAFHWSKRTGEVTDITSGNTSAIINKDEDPGGRIGPYIYSGSPDLRNLMLYQYPCEEDDMILITTHGVHENLDPEYVGLLPLDVQRLLNSVQPEKEKQAATARDEEALQSWSKIDPIKSQAFRDWYRESYLAKLINELEEPVTPRVITKAVIDYCLRNTTMTREYMEMNPNVRTYPKDFRLYPGKMDHTTCVTFQVGRIYRSS